MFKADIYNVKIDIIQCKMHLVICHGITNKDSKLNGSVCSSRIAKIKHIVKHMLRENKRNENSGFQMLAPPLHEYISASSLQ